MHRLQILYKQRSINRGAEARRTEWWLQNVNLTKDKTQVSTSTKMIITSDTSLEGWETFYQGRETGVGQH